MLIQFRFKNFKSFKDDTILDLSATKITEHSDRVVQAGNEKVLSTAAIFGANASGKSNVIEAFRFMATYVIESFAFGGEGDEKKSKTKKLKHTPFLFDKESRDSESSFEGDFLYGHDSVPENAVQVCYELTSENREREVRGLVETCRKFPEVKPLIVTFNQKDKISYDGMIIEAIPAVEFFTA